jgi:hypothetical protein
MKTYECFKPHLSIVLKNNNTLIWLKSLFLIFFLLILSVLCSLLCQLLMKLIIGELLRELTSNLGLFNTYGHFIGLVRLL